VDKSFNKMSIPVNGQREWAVEELLLGTVLMVPYVMPHDELDWEKCRSFLNRTTVQGSPSCRLNVESDQTWMVSGHVRLTDHTLCHCVAAKEHLSCFLNRCNKNTIGPIVCASCGGWLSSVWSYKKGVKVHSMTIPRVIDSSLSDMPPSVLQEEQVLQLWKRMFEELEVILGLRAVSVKGDLMGAGTCLVCCSPILIDEYKVKSLPCGCTPISMVVV
jgi:hypothetical protein